MIASRSGHKPSSTMPSAVGVTVITEAAAVDRAGDRGADPKQARQLGNENGMRSIRLPSRVRLLKDSKAWQ